MATTASFCACRENDGDIVVALVCGDEGTSVPPVKRCRRERARVWLGRANPDYEPIEPPFLRVLGEVTGLLRRL